MRPHTPGRALFVAVAVALLAPCSSSADEWKQLFNGKDLTGWQAKDGPISVWHVDNGVLYCDGDHGGWLATKENYKNFELELEFRLPPGGNSGIFLREPEVGHPAYDGMEIQVLDDPAPVYATIQPWQHCGSLYGLAPAKPGALKPAGEWQKYQILCDGPHVRVTLNGTVVVDANLNDYADGKTTDGKSHPGTKRTEGLIGLQNHDTRIEYRNLRIRQLP